MTCAIPQRVLSLAIQVRKRDKISEAGFNVSVILGFLNQTGQIIVIALGGGSVVLNTVLIITLCAVGCINKRKKTGSREMRRTTPSSLIVTRKDKVISALGPHTLLPLPILENNLSLSPSLQNVHHELADLAPHNISTFQPARRPVQNQEMADRGMR